MTWIFPTSQRSKRGIEMNNTMIPILPELKSAMKQVTKQYQSDFDLDTKVIQKAAKEAKADGKPQTFLWFCRESGTYIARESNAYLKESPMYISYHYYADQQRREAKGIKHMSSPLRDLMAENPWGSQRPSTTSRNVSDRNGMPFLQIGLLCILRRRRSLRKDPRLSRAIIASTENSNPSPICRMMLLRSTMRFPWCIRAARSPAER